MCFRVAEILDGKGAGKKGRFQGKANKLQNRHVAEKLLKDFCAERQSWTLVNAMIAVCSIKTDRDIMLMVLHLIAHQIIKPNY